MPKIYADIPKFKRIEASIRKTTVSCSETISEIDAALTAKRTEKEKELLNVIRADCIELQKKARALINNLYAGVE